MVSSCWLCTTSRDRARHSWGCWTHSGSRKATSHPAIFAVFATAPCRWRGYLVVYLPRTRYSRLGSRWHTSGPHHWTRRRWLGSSISDDGKAMDSGRRFAHRIPIDNGISLGSATIPLRDFPAPAHYRLVAGLEGTPFENDWDIWVYPPQVETQAPAGVMITNQFEDQAKSALQRGGRVLLLVPPGKARGDRWGKVALGFSSIFWNTAWTRRQPPHTLGILCDPKNPALAEFPTEWHSNWQWWYLVTRADALILDGLPQSLRPTIQVIDDWVTNRRLGLVLEALVSAGKLMICSIDLERDLDSNAVARQLRSSLLHYMASENFKPDIKLSIAQVQSLLKEN